MESLAFLDLAISVGILIISVSFAYAAYNFIQTLKPLKTILQRVDDATKGIEIVREGVKLGVKSVLDEVIKKLKEGGDKKWANQPKKEE
ncbi:hypothetical protein A3D00_05565 [Candidatus Woesebacteria bacterium RIFCSPHIGHO2_02_FULL_38_9]|uniref:Uncharacterized protein n=1 Tax=Candidatus Woesebacteria bacterium RIFCSPHIGHO2_01_FULL_39_28 TaxID=1802496 RepID=A0A1F7YIY0_9BACT|nr:MAG: hypothetical protein A2627_05945 [Candidatus Woesebacteria bacterium RIFCSPHIGHO2_01_FULL_39_28]OGM32022.1 MAG: hypothetical protein A3D00_05565 [Candidatus Woesebacteria bacterium RIFCSPHIGHO2_02_FULL_38_9]OGM57129.1 MAG: hypothetical protein A3A50_00355 [Candidatus Woesebacteria bacterium RIFCSPLOWO2_01_FULL_38_20]